MEMYVYVKRVFSPQSIPRQKYHSQCQKYNGHKDSSVTTLDSGRDLERSKERNMSRKYLDTDCVVLNVRMKFLRHILKERDLLVEFICFFPTGQPQWIISNHFSG